jgi:hypothetical protein
MGMLASLSMVARSKSLKANDREVFHNLTGPDRFNGQQVSLDVQPK